MKEVIAYISVEGWVYTKKGINLGYNELYDYSQLAQSMLKNFLVVKDSTCLGTAYTMEETLHGRPTCHDFGVRENHMVGIQYSKQFLVESCGKI